MKKYSRTFISLSALILFVSCFLFSSCKENEETAPNETLALLSSGTWHIINVTVDGVERDDLFIGFTLTFLPETYTSTGGNPVWTSSGTWAFANSTSSVMTRDDGTMVTIASLTDTSLTLTLQWNQTTLGGGRINSISGKHVFEFNK
jgi:hypothetical protein